MAVSGFRVFGIGSGEKPEPVNSVQTRRKDSGMTCHVRWAPAANADGYNIRYGIAPDKLYSSFQVYGDCDATLVTLNGEKDYWLAVDAFNSSGITPGKPGAMKKAK